MAFTTNGNMHRHMRTHEKEGIDLDEHVLRGEYTRPRKRVPSKRLLDSAEDYSLSPAKRLTLDESRIVYSPVEDMKVNEGEVLNCPVCGKSFLCKYGLQTHMDLHPNLALRCSMCDSLFRNHRGLRMHIHMAHKRHTDSGKDNDQIPLGFQDLSFMEFSTSKFPLVAQVWCEQNVRRCNSVEHRFICPACNKAFPCNSALDLHVKNAHSNQTSKEAFSGSPSSDKENQLNSAMEHFAVIDKLDDAAKEECQKEFMAALHLKPVQKVKKVVPAVVPATPGLLMVPSGPLDKGVMVREFNYNHAMKMNDMANPLLATKARVMDFADVRQILKLTSDSGNPLSLLHQPGQSKRSPLKGLTPDAMSMPSEAVPSGGMPGELQAAKLPPTLPPVPRQDTRGEPLSGDIATEMHIPMEDASRHRLQMLSPAQSDITSGLEDDSSSQPGSESDNESLYGLKKLKGRNHTCRYCDKTFPFASTLKVHMRTHLGLTPYKCMLCTYSSADKSTLVRHMRTHSGERPYACKICKFPFTTKANCERHIKKRHNKETKADIELCIEHCSLPNTSMTLDGKFCSPDTVCKICNRDFKFFRDLQNHLRVHERTPMKPFVCQCCQMSFSSRGNCARHIIKSHPEVGESNIEKTIIVHEISFSDTQSIATDDSTYLDDLINSDIPQSEPLDFSMKGSNSRFGYRSPSPLISDLALYNTDGPIDLSIPKPGASITGGKLRFKRVYHKFYSRLVDALVCPHCSQAFAHGSLFKQHIRSHTMERPHRCYFCAAAFTMKENLDKHIEKRHPTSTITDRPTQAFIPKIATPMQFKLNVARTSQAARQQSPFETSDHEGTGTPTPPPAPEGELSVMTDLMTSLPQNAHQAPVIVNTNYNSTDSSVELSSISRILANTSSSNFQNLLTPPLMTTSSTGSPLLMTALSTNAAASTSTTQVASKEVRNVPVIMKTLEQVDGDADVVFIKEEPRCDSPATSLASPSPQPPLSYQQLPPFPPSLSVETSQSVKIPQPVLNPDILSQALRNDLAQDLSNDADQTDEPIPLEKTPAGKELLRKQTCPYCFRKFPWISSLKRHILTHTGLKPYQCPQCKSSFSTKSNCERHIVRRHCGGTRGGESSLDNSPAATPGGVPPSEQLFVCLECKEVAFSTKYKLEKHYESTHPMSPFPDCYIEPKQVLDLSSTSQDSSTSSSALDLSVKSPMMSNPSATRVTLPSYFQHHHHQQSSVIKEGKRLLKKAAAVKLKKRSHEYGQIHDEDIMPTDPSVYATGVSPTTDPSTYNNFVMKFTMKPSQHSCHMCSKRFKSSTALKRHHRVHTLEHPFQCLKCQACFTTKFNCQRHMQKLHGMSKEEVASIKEMEVPHRVPNDLPTMVALPEPGQSQVSSTDTLSSLKRNATSTVSRVVTPTKPGNISMDGDKTSESGMNSDTRTEVDEDSNLSVNLSEGTPTQLPRESMTSPGALVISEPDSSSNSELPTLKSQEDEAQLRLAAAQVAAITRPSSSLSSTTRKDNCISPSNDDDDENEDIKKFKELDPDITVVNPKTPSEEGDDAKNMTWTLDSNVTASPEESNFAAEASQMRRSPVQNSNEAFSTPADEEIMPSGMGNSDIIQNLLGIQDSSVIDQMLDTPDSQTAAKLLGV